MNNYYVYIYEDNNIPFYVGMGTGDRMFHHLNEVMKDRIVSGNSHKVNKVKKIVNEDRLPHIIKVDDNLSREQAIELEIFLIEIIGRSDLNLGTLTNMTNGGEGGVKPSMLSLQKRFKTCKERYGYIGVLSNKDIELKKENTCKERYGESSYSKTDVAKDKARDNMNNRVINGTHWCQQETNKDLIREKTLQQVKDGKNYFTSEKHKEERSKFCKENNTKRNNIRKRRPDVLKLKEIYIKLNMKQPSGGIWNKSDEWLRNELLRLGNSNVK